MPGSLQRMFLVRTPKHVSSLISRSLSANADAQSKEDLKPYESIPLVTGGLPFIGSMARLGDKPGGLPRAVDNIRKLRTELGQDGKDGIIRMTGPAMNPEGDGRVVMVFHPDDVKAVFG